MRYRTKSLQLAAGTCRCIREPRCAEGLEGYDFGEQYQYQERQNNTGRYFRIYHRPDYYETCGPHTFLKHFEVV